MKAYGVFGAASVQFLVKIVGKLLVCFVGKHDLVRGLFFLSSLSTHDVNGPRGHENETREESGTRSQKERKRERKKGRKKKLLRAPSYLPFGYLSCVLTILQAQSISSVFLRGQH